jgi:RimJ/RimL family protein N-acetyltransferase
MKDQFSKGKIIIRRYRQSDKPGRLASIRMSQTALSEWFNWSSPDEQEDENSEWFELYEHNWQQGVEYPFMIAARTSGMHLGECKINHINKIHRLANIAYWVRKDVTGQGIATDATLLLVRFGFFELRLNRLEIFMSLRNAASRRVAEKIGAPREGVLRNRILHRDGIEDAVLYSLIPADLK